MREINWDEVQDAVDFDSPTPGGYIATICNYEDMESKECLKILWDYADGSFVGYNKETFDRAGFWPVTLYRSYKEKALPFFKAFKTSLEESNPGYVFREDHLNSMIGKRFGVVLGEEEYRKNDGSLGKRLYVAATRSVQSIISGDFEVPEMKLIANAPVSNYSPIPATTTFAPAGFSSGFFPIEDDEGELPF